MYKNTGRRTIFLLPLCMILSMMTGAPAVALQQISGNRVVINKAVYDNIYITAGYVIINAPVHGDVIIAGGRVTINDSVYKDVLIAGGEVEIKGVVGEDLRCAGGRIKIHRDVAGDVILLGGAVEADSSARLGNLYGSVGSLLLSAHVTGNVKLYGGELIFNGIVEGNTELRGEVIRINGSLEKGGAIAAPELYVGPAAWFGKEVRFWNRPGQLASANPFIQKTSVYDPTLRINETHWYYLGFTNIFSMLLYLLMMLVLLSAIHAAFPRMAKRAGIISLHKPGRLLLNGFLYFVGVPLLGILAISSVVGLPLAIVVLALYALLLLCSGVIFSLVLAHHINELKASNWYATRLNFAGVGIFVLLKLLQTVPVAGYVLAALAACWTAGAITAALKRARDNSKLSL